MGKVICLQCKGHGALVSPVESGGAKVSPCPYCKAGEIWSAHYAQIHPNHTGPACIILPPPTTLHEHLLPLLANIDIATAWKGLLETGMIETNSKPLWRGLIILAREHQMDYRIGVPQFRRLPSKGFRVIRLRQFQPVLTL